MAFSLSNYTQWRIMDRRLNIKNPTCLLFCPGLTGSLVHSDIGDAHSAEYGEGLEEVFIVGGEGKILEFVD